MKLTELESEVLSLMFESELDSRSAFIRSANRALAEIHTQRDRIRTRSFYMRELRPAAYYAHIYRAAAETVRIAAVGHAFSVKIIGKCTLSFTKDGSYYEIMTVEPETVIKEIFDTSTGEIEFAGEYDCEMINLAFFDKCYSDDDGDIEYLDGMRSYNVKRRDKSFLAFVSAPKDKYGRPIRGAYASGDTVYLPRGYIGDVYISYKYSSRMLSINEVDTAIDIEAECAHLLPLLTASYLLADDNPELSAHYLSLYREGMAAVKVYNRQSADTRYHDVLGWCK